MKTPKQVADAAAWALFLWFSLLVVGLVAYIACVSTRGAVWFPTQP